MQLRTKHGLRTLHRAHAFLAAQDIHTALGDLAPQVAALQHIITLLDGHVTEQAARASAARAAAASRQQRLRTLRLEFLRPIAHMSRTLLGHDPAVRRAFRLPRSRGAAGLLQAANAFIEIAEQNAERFIAQGLAEDFVERMKTAVDAFREVQVTHEMEIARRAASTAGQRAMVTKGRALVTLIDLMLSPRLEGDAARLAEWKSVAHFTRTTPRHATGEEEADEVQGARDEVRDAGAMTTVPSVSTLVPLRSEPEVRAA